jgi:hypothetical protein
MKRIKLFEDFVNEGMSFQEIKDKYLDNPYGIGAETAEYLPGTLIFRHSNRYDRDQIEKNLRALGVPAKKMNRWATDKSYQYRYELVLFENSVNESKQNDLKNLKDYKVTGVDFNDKKGIVSIALEKNKNVATLQFTYNDDFSVLEERANEETINEMDIMGMEPAQALAVFGTILLGSRLVYMGIQSWDSYDTAATLMPITKLKKWWNDRKRDKEVQSIVAKLKGDPEIIEFLKLSPKEQEGKWRKVIEPKLSIDELAYLKNIYKKHFSE